MALGFTSHYTNSEQPFGSLILSSGEGESETSGSVASSNSNSSVMNGLLYNNSYDSCEFSVSVNIDYSQYANYVASSGSAETAGSVAFSGGSFSSAGSVSTSSGGASFSGGGCSVSSGGGGCSASFTC